MGQIQILRLGVHAGVPKRGDSSVDLISQTNAWNGQAERPAVEPCNRAWLDTSACICGSFLLEILMEQPKGQPSKGKPRSVSTPIYASADYLQNGVLGASAQVKILNVFKL